MSRVKGIVTIVWPLHVTLLLVYKSVFVCITNLFHVMLVQLSLAE